MLRHTYVQPSNRRARGFVGALVSAKLQSSLKTQAIFFALVMAIAGSCTFAQPARAATIDTFDITQSGYNDHGALLNNITGTISGTFSGTPDAAGFISLAGLTGFSLNGGTALPTFFSFDINGGSSSFDLAINNDGNLLMGVVCVGAAAAFGGNLTGINCGPGGSNGYANVGLTFVTGALPVVALVSSVTTAAAPEPSPGFLCLSLIPILAGAKTVRRRTRSAQGRTIQRNRDR